MKAAIITDNRFMYQNVTEIIRDKKYSDIEFDFFCSKGNDTFIKELNTSSMRIIYLKEQFKELIDNYNIIFSMHCKQLFPDDLVNSVRCINVHPGLNPYNRGWYPQVFSLINKLPLGVTIHEIDTQLDHGPIIVQKEIEVFSWETSSDLYKKIQVAEIELLKLYLEDILYNNYSTFIPAFEGNINYKRDFTELCRIDLNEKSTYSELIDKLRALTFTGYENAYFFDNSGNKIYCSIMLHKAD